MGTRKMQDLLRHAQVKIKNLGSKVKHIVTHCKACQLTNPTPTIGGPSAGTQRGDKPSAYWEADFTELPRGTFKYKYLLVFVDTFSGWVEAYPTRKETAAIVTRKLLEELLPRYGFPAMIGSDNGPAFVSKVTEGLASVLGAD